MNESDFSESSLFLARVFKSFFVASMIVVYVFIVSACVIDAQSPVSSDTPVTIPADRCGVVEKIWTESSGGGFHSGFVLAVGMPVIGARSDPVQVEHFASLKFQNGDVQSFQISRNVFGSLEKNVSARVHFTKLETSTVFDRMFRRSGRVELIPDISSGC